VANYYHLVGEMKQTNTGSLSLTFCNGAAHWFVLLYAVYRIQRNNMAFTARGGNFRGFQQNNLLFRNTNTISAAQKSRIYFNFEDEYFVANQGIT
jgi:hypothetical protein